MVMVGEMQVVVIVVLGEQEDSIQMVLIILVTVDMVIHF